MVARKKNDDALVLALACGATVEAAARQCDLSERTVYTRLKDPDFQKRVRLVRTDMVRRAAGLLSAASGEAVRTLLALMKESAPPAARLGAAKAVLELGIKVRELAELEAEVRELEAKVDALGPPDGDRRW
ncbi:hypothetical protein I8748_29795 [Nostoc sp. CENA67]|uniref:Uncharacterized protein n=1 Tax=Amazonocrinis nigriterrae CENA67 TaxID=2794033 RepID=A0A8J7HZ39_9NOST|nr:hypothetical protein [Amazonocrinis nigriterrae]MBH8566300.1 hypothetical protein [Amazonocrinis nigriterrae CENA67]